MSATGLAVFDTTVQKTNEWVNEMATQLGEQDKHRAFQGMRLTLHILRDRLPPEEAAHLGAQLPILLAGFYYEGWRPVTSPSKERSKEEFIEKLQSELRNVNPGADPEQIIRTTFKVIANRVSPGEVSSIKAMMPPAIADLWPQTAQAQ